MLLLEKQFLFLFFSIFFNPNWSKDCNLLPGRFQSSQEGRTGMRRVEVCLVLPPGLSKTSRDTEMPC